MNFTNKQVMEMYDRYLSNVCGCWADSVGNRPCNNGSACDRCEWMKPSFDEYMESEEKNHG